jgi:peptidoglycan/xylan/chitin deacetylase (PgdA/CDA1 family)
LKVAWANEPPTSGARTMAVTVDDVIGWEEVGRAEVNTAILATLRAHHVPAVGFVNESQLYYPPRDTRILSAWLDAGMELGNHTYSHADLNEVGAERFESEILRGETVTRGLLAKRGAALRWFRYPRLHTGKTAQDKAGVAAFLAQHGYANAPVTLENDDWMFSQAYVAARKAGDTRRMDVICKLYLDHWSAVLDFYEAQGRELFGRDIAQVVLLHDNPLNAVQLGAVLTLFESRGYAFVPLEVALADVAYSHTDTYVGSWGKSWIQRWWVSEGRPNRMREEPLVPAEIGK